MHQVVAYSNVINMDELDLKKKQEGNEMGLIILGVGCTVNMLELVRDQKLIVIPN
jgi:hypothetical protein